MGATTAYPEDIADSRLAYSDVQLELDGLGRAQRVASWVQFALVSAALAPVAVRDPSVWLLAAIAASLFVAVASLRVRAWLADGVLIVRGHLRTRRFDLDRVELFCALPYAGMWSGGVSGDLFGLWELDGERRGYSGSFSLPATMASRRRVERLERALDELIEGGR